MLTSIENADFSLLIPLYMRSIPCFYPELNFSFLLYRAINSSEL